MFLDLNLVAFKVDDLVGAKQWYTRLLGSGPVMEEPDSIVFNIGRGRLGLRLDHSSGGGADSGTVAYWGVSDIRAEHGRLLELGASEFGGIQDMGPGFYRARVRDPFGNILGIIAEKEIPDNKAIEEKPSRTALWTTLMRAYASHEDNGELRGPDYLAEIFLPPGQARALKDPGRRQDIREEYFVIGVYEYVTARTIVFDRFFTGALNQNIEQIVFLGAGYDSRPYRFPDRIKQTRIFELDAAPTQNNKQQCLIRAEVDIPGQLSYVPINFNTESIKDKLMAAGFDTSKKTLFMWEGVTYYLSAEAVDATLEFIRSGSPAGSLVAFDYIAVWPGVLEAYGVRELVDYNSKKQSGESGGMFNIVDGEIESFLNARGFETAVHYNSEQIESNFLTHGDGSLLGRVTGSFRIVQATNKY